MLAQERQGKIYEMIQKEGAVTAAKLMALFGVSIETVRRDRPALAVSLYHRSEDLFTLTAQVADMCGNGYSYHLRRVPCFPCWDLVLYAVPDRLKKA